MKILDIINTSLINEEELQKGKRGIIFLDLDDTCLKDNVSRIYRKLPTDKKEIPLTTGQFAKENVLPENKKYYDFRDFRDNKVVYNAIAKSPRLVKNLKAIDSFVRGGYEIGILTARGCENTIYKAVKDSFKFRDKNGKLIKANIKRSNVYAVNDESKHYPAKTDYDNKKEILKKYAHSDRYDYVYFIDDDNKNIKALKELKKNLPLKKAYKLRSIKANIEEGLNYGTELLVEMALKDLNSNNILQDIKDGNYETAAINYVKVMRAQTDKEFPEFIQKLTTYGARTFRSAEKKGLIPEGSGEKMVNTIRRVGPSVETEEEKAERIKRTSERNTKIETEKKETKKKLDSMSSSEKNFYELEKGIKKIKDRIVNIKEVGKKLTIYGVNTKLNNTESGLSDNNNRRMTDTRSRIITGKIDSLKRFIPPIIYKEKLTSDEKKDIDKSAGLGEVVVESTKLRIYLNKYVKYMEGVVYTFEDALDEMKEENPSITKGEMYEKMTSPNYAFFNLDKYKNVVDYSKKRLKTINLEADLAKGKMGKADEKAPLATLGKERFKEARDLDSAYRGDNFKDYVRKNMSSYTVELNNMFNENIKEDINEEIAKKRIIVKKKPTGKVLKVKPKTLNSYSNDDEAAPATKYKHRTLHKDNEESEIISALPASLKSVFRKRLNNTTGNTKQDARILREYIGSDNEKLKKRVFEIVANIVLSKVEVIDMLTQAKNLPKLETQEDRDRFENRKNKIITKATLKYKTDGQETKYKKYNDIYTGGDEGLEKEKWREVRAIINKIDFKDLKANGILSAVVNNLGLKYERTKYNSAEIDELYKGITSVKGNYDSSKEKRKQNIIDTLKKPSFSKRR